MLAGFDGDAVGHGEQAFVGLRSHRLRYNAAMIRLLIVGAGDVAQRLLPLLVPRYKVFVLLRDAGRAAAWRQAGATPLVGDLDRPDSLRRLRGLAHWVVHLAPPPAAGPGDPRTVRLAAALRGASSLPQRLVYISTSGVYGDCAGARIDETRPVRPATARARRRVAAEAALRGWGARPGAPRVTVLRVPGIYAAERLPRERLQAGTPVLTAADDVYTNHIHADDLARVIVAALRRGRANRVVHASDDSELRMGDYFDLVADAFGLPRPPRVGREEAVRRLPPSLLSFMSESRRLDNRRLRTELRVRLRYPTVRAGVLAAARADLSTRQDPAC